MSHIFLKGGKKVGYLILYEIVAQSERLWMHYIPENCLLHVEDSVLN